MLRFGAGSGAICFGLPFDEAAALGASFGAATLLEGSFPLGVSVGGGDFFSLLLGLAFACAAGFALAFFVVVPVGSFFAALFFFTDGSFFWVLMFSTSSRIRTTLNLLRKENKIALEAHKILR